MHSTHSHVDVVTFNYHLHVRTSFPCNFTGNWQHYIVRSISSNYHTFYTLYIIPCSFTLRNQGTCEHILRLTKKVNLNTLYIFFNLLTTVYRDLEDYKLYSYTNLQAGGEMKWKWKDLLPHDCFFLAYKRY